MAGQDAARDARGPSWGEFAGTFSWPDGGSVAVVRRQEGRGSARNLARAPLNWASQGQRWGSCKVRRRAERVSLPAMEKKRRRRVLVVTICSPRPMRAVQRARLWAITCTASQAALAAKRQGCGIGVPWASRRIPAWADPHNDPLANHSGYQYSDEPRYSTAVKRGIGRSILCQPETHDDHTGSTG